MSILPEPESYFNTVPTDRGIGITVLAFHNCDKQEIVYAPYPPNEFAEVEFRIDI